MSKDIRSSCGSDHLRVDVLALLVAHEFVGWALDDAACDGQLCADTGKVGIDVTGSLSALVDAPNNQTLTTSAITVALLVLLVHNRTEGANLPSSENTGEIRRVVSSRRFDVLPLIEVNRAS